jgi:hypothetical protein
MLILMRKFSFHYLVIGICLFFSSESFSQSINLVQDIGLFLNDATLYADKYIAPATDAAVYQSSSNWITSPKKRKLYDVVVSLHGNVFFVPNQDRSFEINNSDFSFLSIENATSATVPTASGDDSQHYLVGEIDSNPIRIQTPRGVNQETVFYPYLQGSIALWNGFEAVAKYSTKVNLKRGDYQVYGFGVKHNFSHYFKSLEKYNVNLAALLAYSKEDMSFDFLSTTTPLGDLGLNAISSNVNTLQFQISASKDWKNFELMMSAITNKSDFKYFLSGDKGQVEAIIPVQDILNDKLTEIYKTKYNTIGELSGRYQISSIYIQSTIAFGRFINTNLAVQYEF